MPNDDPMPNDDHDLIRRFTEAADESAFRRIVERHAAAVLRVAHAVTADHQTAEDATQETFIAVCRGLRQGRYQRGRSLRAWILGIAAKRALHLARGRRRARRREEGYAMKHRHPALGPREAAQRNELSEQLAIALGDLSLRSRMVLELHYREGLTHAEVAAVLGIARGTVKSRLSRALNALRERLGPRHANLSVAALPSLLADLPAPEPTPELLDACVTKAWAAPAGVTVTMKAATAIALAGIATVFTLFAVAAPDRTKRADREVAARHATVPTRVGPSGATEPAATGAEAGQEAKPGRSARPADSAARGHVETADPTSEKPAGEARKPESVIHHRDLPEGVQIIRSGDRAKPGSNAQPGRFQPVPRRGGRRGGRYAQPPPYRGESTLIGQVVDAAGTPVEGAVVYRMPVETDREASTVVSFEFLTKVATTDAEGKFSAGKQAHGTFLLVANYQRRLNRPRGMETRDAMVVQVQEKGTAENLVLRLPFNVGDSVPLQGVVTDAEGRPVRGAQVFVDYQETRTDAEGRFDAGKIPAGSHTILVRRTGYQNLEGEVVAERGRDNTVQLVLELEEKGDLRFAGQVLDTEGNPVVDAVLYLNHAGRTLRRIRTDGKGTYAFEKLPPDLADGGCSINVWLDGYFPKRVEDVPVPSDMFEIRIEHSYRVLLKIVNAADGSPLSQTRGEVRRETTVDGNTEFKTFLKWSTYSEKGVHDIRVPSGKVQFEVEAPGHALTTLVVEIAPDDKPREVEMHLVLEPGKTEEE